jgi:acetyl-CoA C-acetyltransferase
MQQAYIYDAIRTARGRAKAEGGLADLSPLELLKNLYDHIAIRNHLDPQWIEDVVLGCVTQMGEQGGNIAKASLMYSHWPDSVPGITVNRFCSSGLDAINLAAMKVMTGQGTAILAGGIEMMSRIPMLSDKAILFADHAVALQSRMLLMGSGADLIASNYGISRQQVDQIAYDSQQRAARARREGYFTSIVPITNPVSGKVVDRDECIREHITLQQLADLPPAFADLGAMGVDELQLSEQPQLDHIEHVHTAGNSPAMADAAALVLIGDTDLEQRLGKPPVARIRAVATTCEDPLQVVSGCSAATRKLLTEQRLEVADIDLFELHEAFAATSILCQQQLQIDADKLNVNGGVIAMGHPMGATGAIMMGTLIDELKRRELQTGIVATSGAAGTGTAMLISLC